MDYRLGKAREMLVRLKTVLIAMDNVRFAVRWGVLVTTDDMPHPSFPRKRESRALKA